MNRAKAILFIVLSTFYLFPMMASAQGDLYSFPQVDDVPIYKPAKPRFASPFVQAVSKIMKVPEKDLTKAVEKGFGRTELIRLILISQKSKKPLEDLIQAREKGTWFSKMAKSAGLDNKAIRREANALLPRIEQEEEKIKMAVEVSTPTAGVADTLSKETTEKPRNEGTEKLKNQGDQ